MERAKAFIVDACLAEGDKFFHDIDDVGGAHDAFYGFSVYHSFSDFKKSRGVPGEAKFKYEVGGGLFLGCLVCDPARVEIPTIQSPGWRPGYHAPIPYAL